MMLEPAKRFPFATPPIEPNRERTTMLEKNLFKTYLHYIVPSSLAFALQGAYSVIDGLFLGHSSGDAALAGVNLAYPLVALVLAVGTGIGMGGAVIGSIRLGEGNVEGSRRAMAHTITTLLLAAVPVMALLVCLHGPLLYLMGARGEVLVQAQRYMAVMAWGSVFQVLTSGFMPLIRNKGKVVFAMGIMMTGGLLNCLGDYFMVFRLHWGPTGVALATVASQAFVFSCCALFFLKRENRMPAADFKPNALLLKRTLRNGVAPFALTLVPEVATIAMNLSAGAYGGGTAQAAFAVMSYTCVPLQWVGQGVSDGSQPLISRAFGMGNLEAARSLRNANFCVAVGIGLLSIALLNGFMPQLALIFGISPEATRLLAVGMFMYSISMPFYGFTHATTSFFYATESAGQATAIIVCESAGIAAFAAVLPLFFGLDGSWASIPATQVLLFGIASLLLVRSRKGMQQRACEQATKAQANLGE